MQLIYSRIGSMSAGRSGESHDRVRTMIVLEHRMEREKKEERMG